MQIYKGGGCYQMRRHNGAGANSKSVIRSRTATAVVVTVLVQEAELCCDYVVRLSLLRTGGDHSGVLRLFLLMSLYSHPKPPPPPHPPLSLSLVGKLRLCNKTVTAIQTACVPHFAGKIKGIALQPQK